MSEVDHASFRRAAGQFASGIALAFGPWVRGTGARPR